MSFTLSTGATLSVAKTYSPAYGVAGTSITAITNANPAVCSATNTLAAGDYVLINSGWGLLDSRVVRVASSPAPTGGTFALEGVDTSDTTKYPAAGGAGSFKKITAWTALSQIKGVSASGGTQQFADITCINDVTKRNIPTVKDAVNMTIEVFDDPSLSWYADVMTADLARSPYGVLMTFANDSKLAGNAYWALSRIPNIATNEALTAQISLSFAGEPIRYAT